MKKTVLMIMMAFVLVGSLTACGDSKKSTETDAKQETTISEKDKKEATEKKTEAPIDQKDPKADSSDTDKKENKTADKEEKTNKSSSKTTSKPQTTSGSNQSSTSSKPSNTASTKPSKPANSGGNSTNKPTPSKPASHKHNYTQVVYSYSGNCVDKSYKVKRCSCGEEKYFESGYGNHAWEYIPEQKQWIPVYKYVYECNKCHKQFGHDEDAAALHSAEVCGSGYSYKQIGVEEGKGHWQVNVEAYYYCPLCKKIREINE